MKHHENFFGKDPKYVEPMPITELPLSEYSYDNLRIASKDWTEPVVVRQMFADSPARNWVKSKDFSGMSSLNKFNVSVIQNSTMGKDHYINCRTNKGKDSIMTPFEDAMKEILDYDPTKKIPSKTIVLPPASRSEREENHELDAAFHDLIEKDLDLKSFGGDWE